MSITNDVIVVPRTFLEATDLLQTSFAAQPPHFGVTSGFDAGNDPPDTSTVNVLWDTTVFDLDVPITSLRQIVPAQAASISQFGGKLVRSPLNSQSEEYIGAVILLGGIIFNPSAEAPVVEFAVIKSIGPGLFFWVSKIAELAVVPFR
jgi:hypothetical protein